MLAGGLGRSRQFWLYEARFGGWRGVGRRPAEGAVSRPRTRFGRNPACGSADWWASCSPPQPLPSGPVAGRMKRIRIPSPAMAIACLALFVALSGVAYAAATIGSDEHRRRLDQEPRLQGRHPARQRGQARRLRRRRDQGEQPGRQQAQRHQDRQGHQRWRGRRLGPARRDLEHRRARARARHHVRQQDRRRPVPGDLRCRRAQLHVLRDAR